MKCEKCGAELKPGNVYCSVCGNAVQLVPDYNLLDEDMLGDIIQKEARGSKKDAAPELDRKKKAKKKKRIAAGIGAAVLITVFLVTFFVYQKAQEFRMGSYEYQFKKAEQLLEEGDYNGAAAYFLRALSLRAADPAASKRLASIYLEQEEETEAVLLLEELADAGGADEEALRMLIDIYDGNREYDKILELSGKVNGEALPLLFGDYLVDTPAFGVEPGVYGEELTVTMQAEPECEILYTTDGEDPGCSGTVYRGGIALEEEGTTVFFAVARNRKGICSKVAKASYTLRFEMPDMPSVSPDGGTYNEPQQITVSVPEGCTAYYTWDGSDPGVQSAKYTGAIEMLPGNQVLSVVAVDEAGRKSGVYRVNYVYLP